MFQINSSVLVYPRRVGGDDEMVRIQLCIRAAIDGPRDLPEVLVEELVVYQHFIPC